MAFDIVRFCEDFDIEYFTEGKNVTSGWINIQCPFCDDKSNHLGFDLKTNVFNCWKCGNHFLRDVLSSLTYISDIDYLGRIAKEYSVIEQPFNLRKSPKYPVAKNKILKWPEGIINHIPRAVKKYLKKRNFDAYILTKKYNLYYTMLFGDYAGRIIIPVIYGRKTVSYVGRDYTNQQELRYKTCRSEDEIIPHKNILYNLDNCTEEWVIVVEGCFDVFRIGDNCCATMGTGFTNYQIAILAKRFKRIFILYDIENEAQKQAKKLAENLNLLGRRTIILKYDAAEFKDPAEFDRVQINILKNFIVREGDERWS